MKDIEEERSLSPRMDSVAVWTYRGEFNDAEGYKSCMDYVPYADARELELELADADAEIAELKKLLEAGIAALKGISLG